MKHSMLKCLSIVMALATILGVFAVPVAAVVAQTCNHYAYEENWTYIGEKDPTCTEYGGKIYKCPNCNQEFVDTRDWEKGNYKPTGHDMEEIKREEATLEADGYVLEKCKVCGYEETTPLYATKCPNNSCDLVVDLEAEGRPTCTEPGVITYKCKNCPNVVVEESAALGHAWDKGVITTAPQCGIPNADPALAVDPVDGVITFSCTRCDEGEKTEIVEAPQSHKLLWHDAKEAKCGEPGNTAGYTCANEGCTYVSGYSVVDIGDHVWVDMDHEENRAVDCEAGIQWKECSNANCDETKKEILDPETDPNGWHNPNGTLGQAHLGTPFASTCTKDGYYVCSACHAEIVNENDPAEHDWYKVQEQAASCKQYGFILWSCDACGAAKRDSYKDELGNVLNPGMNIQPHTKPQTGVVTVDPTCITDGYLSYTCTVCSLAIKEPTGAKRTGHNPEQIPGQAATCTQDGWKTGWKCTNENCECDCDPTDPNYACANGHVVKGELIPAPGHDFQAAHVAADCVEAEHDGFVCTRCGIEDETANKTNFVGTPDANAHDWDEETYSVTNEPTCVRPGTARAKCTKCNVEGDVEISSLGHDWSAKKIGSVPASCGGQGYDVFVCMRCDAFKQENFVDLQDVQHDRYDTHYIYTAFDALAGSYPFTWTWTDANDKTLGGTFTLVRTHDTDGKSYLDLDLGGALSAEDYCLIHVYEKYNCDSCHYNYTKLYEDQYGATGGHTAIADDITMDCLNNIEGTTGRTVCSRCAAFGKNTIISEGTKVPVQHTVPEANWNAEVPADCYTPGMTAGGLCTACGQDTRVQILALGHKVDGAYSFELVAGQVANCVLNGWKAHFGCTLCDAVVLNTSAAIVDGELDATTLTAADIVADIATAGAANGYVAASGHAWNGTNVFFVPFGCLQDGYRYEVCGNECCDEVQILNYTYGYANHRYTDETNKHSELCKDSWLLCAHQVEIDAAGVASDTYGTLRACADVDEATKREALPHTNAKGDLILGLDSCANWLECQAAEADKATCVVAGKHTCHVCKYCDVEFTFSKIHDYTNDYTVYEYEATCQYKAYVLKICDVCQKETKIEEVGTQLGNHVWDPEKNQNKPASYTEKGYTKTTCSLCGHVETTEHDQLVGIDFDMTIANKNEGQQIVDGSIIAVKIDLTANYGVTALWATLKYNKDLFTYIGFEADNSFGKASANGDQIDFGKTNVVYADATTGTVKMMSTTESAANGALENVTLLGNETYVTLYFRVACHAYDAVADKTFTLQDLGVTRVTEVTDATTGAVSKVEEEVTASSILVNADVVDLAGKIFQLGNINGDGVIANNDVVALRSILLVQGYAAANEGVVVGAADINQDGTINLVDFALLQQYILGALNYEELVATTAA